MDRINKIQEEILKLKKELFELKISEAKKEKEEKKKKNKIAVDCGISKVCSKCGIDRPLSEYKNRVPGQLRADCVYCVGLRNKAYYDKNREKNTVICDCGATVERHYFPHHLNTKKHLKKMKMKPDEKPEPTEQPTDEGKEEIKK